ncbi:MAG: ribonuclease H-like domain-containing protein [Methanoregulaceae archaeon]|nr:ribonuclease H-like domain-containing protein [Methanoregulaceae archaeon]
MDQSAAFDRISREWRSRMDCVHEYAVVRNDNTFRAGFSDSYVLESEFNEVQGLRQSLMEEYRGQELEDVLPGREIETADGACYVIESREPLVIPQADREAVRTKLLHELSLVHGIGRKTELELKRRGYRTIEDLQFHRRFSERARECSRAIRAGDPALVSGLVGRWYPASHPLTLLTAGLYDRTDFVFLDIETLGIFSRPLILVGIATVTRNDLEVRQFLVRDLSEEPASLMAVAEYLHPGAVLVTYNGKTFDIPYLRSRFAFYGSQGDVSNVHYDLLHASRRRWGHSLPDCRLTTIEKRLLGTGRESDIPGGMVPEFYEVYHRTGNPGPLIPIVAHNRQDVVTLAHLFSTLREVSYEC